MNKKSIGAYIEQQLHRAFETWARTRGGKGAKLGISTSSAPPKPGATADKQNAEIRVKIALMQEELAALHAAAEAKGMPTAAWLRSLALAHARRRPQWGPFEWQAFRDVVSILGRVEDAVQRIASATAERVREGEAPLAAAREARMAAEAAERAIRRIGWMVASDLEYWGAEAAPASPAAPARTAAPKKLAA
jgi:hypothetical protein